MMPVIQNVAASKEIAVQAGTHQFSTLLGVTALYLYVSSTDSWVKQGQAFLLTMDAKANLTEACLVSITYDGSTVIYELDKTGDGVAAGHVQVDIHTDTTAATVAARLRTAILANQAALSVTDNTDGTLTVQANGKPMNATASAVGTLAAAETALIPTKADGCMFIPAKSERLFNGVGGPRLAAIRDSADGAASLTPCGIA